MSEASPSPGRLSLKDVVAQSVGFMGPVFSVSVLLPLLVGLNAAGKGGGAAAPLSVLIAGVGVFALSWIVSEYARRIHHAGSLYSYASDGLGVRAGAAAGLLYYAGIIALGAGIAVLVGGYIHDNVDAEFHRAPLPVWGWQLVILAALLVIVHLGVRVSTRVQLVLALLSIGVLTVFFIYVIARVGSANSVKAFEPGTSKDGWGGILFAVLYGVLLFTGFETSANLAEETAHPKRDIPRAMLFSVLVATGLFLLGTYAQVAGYHFSVTAMLKNPGAPLIALGGPHAVGGYGSVWVARLLELVVLLDMVAVYIGVSVAATRGVFALARDRWLPAPLAAVSARRGTPFGGTLLVGALYLIAIGVPNFFPHLAHVPNTPPYAAIFAWLSAYGGFCLAFIYLLVCAGAPRGLRDHARWPFVVGASAVGIAITGAAVFGGIYKVPHPTIFATYAAVGTLALATVCVVGIGGRRVPVAGVELGAGSVLGSGPLGSGTLDGGSLGGGTLGGGS